MKTTCPLLSNATGKAKEFPNPPQDLSGSGESAQVVLSGGCFWCTEAVYRQLDGVLNVTSGYAGDSAETANYAAVSTGTTNHAEAVRIDYDPKRLSFGPILKMFFSVAHNPTYKDRQADDVGRHYRSTVFYETDEQRRVVESYIAALDAALRVAVFSGTARGRDTRPSGRVSLYRVASPSHYLHLSFGVSHSSLVLSPFHGTPITFQKPNARSCEDFSVDPLFASSRIEDFWGPEGPSKGPSRTSRSI